MRTLLLAGAALTGACLACAPARADIIVTLESTQSVNGGTDYTYGVELSSSEQLKNSVQKTFFDIYDFGNAKLVGSTGDLGNGDWQFSNTLLTSSEQAEGVIPNNNPDIKDIRFAYAGPNLTGISLASGTSDNLGTFTVFTTYTGSYSIHDNDQDAQLVKYAPGDPSNNTPSSNVAAVAIPDAPTAVPEPASMALLLTGVVGMCAFGYRRGPRQLKSSVG